MTKAKLLSLILTILMVFSCLGMVFAQADTEDATPPAPPVAENPLPTEPPVVTPTDPVDPVNPTDAQDPTDADVTGPTGTEVTEPTVTEDTTPTETEYVRPTEPLSQPSTYSDYVSPAPIYTPGDQDYNKQNWENLSLEISEVKNSAGPGSFAQMKNDLSKKDRTNPVWLILCIIFWCMSVACITFAVLYKYKEKGKVRAVPATVKTSGSKTQNVSANRSKASRPATGKYEKKYSDYDDYNDGF